MGTVSSFEDLLIPFLLIDVLQFKGPINRLSVEVLVT